MSYAIPFNKPFIVGQELYYMAQSVLGGHTSGDGPFTERCEKLLESAFGAPRVLLTTSCTAALEMAAILCDVGPGDEIILPSYTFVSTANAFYLRGAVLKFVDVRRDTLNLDEALVEASVTDRTKVIVPVHYAGVPCEMEVIDDIARRHGLFVVEDAAQGVNAKFRDSYQGTIGDFGCYSFHETKNFGCGEGGALLIRDPKMIARAEVVREDGTDRRRLFRGEVEEYTWIDQGSAYALPDLLAAFLYAQLDNMGRITTRRREIYEHYERRLAPLAERGLVVLPTLPAGCTTNYHMFYVLLRDNNARASLIEHLKSKGILSVFHYVPLHLSPMGQRMNYGKGNLPVTEDVADRLLRLPFYYELDEAGRDFIADEICRFFGVAPR